MIDIIRLLSNFFSESQSFSIVQRGDNEIWLYDKGIPNSYLCPNLRTRFKLHYDEDLSYKCKQTDGTDVCLPYSLL